VSASRYPSAASDLIRDRRIGPPLTATILVIRPGRTSAWRRTTGVAATPRLKERGRFQAYRYAAGLGVGRGAHDLRFELEMHDSTKDARLMNSAASLPNP